MNTKFIKVSRYIKYIILALLLTALLVPFGPAITWTVSSSSGKMHTPYGTGFNFMFTNTIYGKVGYTSSSITVFPLVAYILLFIAFVLLLLNVFNKKLKNNPLFTPITFVLMLVAAILVVSSHKEVATVLADALIGEHNKHVVETIHKNTSLSIGFVGMAIFGFIGAFASLINLFLDGTIDRIRGK